MYAAQSVIIRKNILKHSIKKMMAESYTYPAFEDEPDLSEVCLVGGDLIEFNAREVGIGIRKLDLSYNMIEKLKGLETSADTLEEVILDNNRLQRIELRRSFPKLHTFSMNKNQIFQLAPLVDTLKHFVPELRHLSLLGNPACPDQLSDDNITESDYQLYRNYMIHHLPNLRFLDHRPVMQGELFESQKAKHSEISFFQMPTPLPQLRKWLTNEKFGVTGFNHKSNSRTKQGKRKYKYVGKNSEGNRFIQDTDL